MDCATGLQTKVMGCSLAGKKHKLRMIDEVLSWMKGMENLIILGDWNARVRKEEEEDICGETKTTETLEIQCYRIMLRNEWIDKARNKGILKTKER